MKKSIILAAGKGTRMRSDLPKVVHELCGRAMINRVLDVTKEIGCGEDIVVVGYRRDVVEDTIDREVKYAEQIEQLGTGHAVMQAKDYINPEDTIFVLYGDMPLFTKETLENMMKYHEDTNADVTIGSVIFGEDCRYGRIIKDENGNVKKVTEYKDATDEERKISEMNAGPAIYNGAVLLDALSKLSNDNAQGEYYLTDVVEIANKEGKKVNSFVFENTDEAFGANSPEELAQAEAIWNSRK